MDGSDSGGGSGVGPGAGFGAEPQGWFELDDAEWYGLDEDAAAALCTEADREFLRVLRQRAEYESGAWFCGPDDTQARHFRERGQGALRLLLTLADEETARHLLTFEVVFDGARIVGEEVDGFGGATAARVEASGSPAELAAVTAEFFKAAAGWRIERREWGTLSRPWYQEWVVVGATPPLSTRWAPVGEWRVAATAGGRPVGNPDNVSNVRGRR
jgi:hypothetical protein